MFPRTFEYISPLTLGEAIEFLDKHKGQAKVLAGGHSLVPLMKLRFVSPQYVVDISRIRNVDYIREKNDFFSIGALTTHYTIETSDIIQKKCGIMSEAASQIGDPQVRNAGTIGGALAHADPAGDWGAVMIVLNSEFKVMGPNGERTIKVDEFFKDTYETALDENEILTEINVPTPSQSNAGAYLKLERRAGDFPTVGVAVQLQIENDTISTAGIGLTAVGSTPLRAARAEESLTGKHAEEKVIEEAAEAASEESEPTSDIRGSAEYKKAIVREFTKRAIRLALTRT